MHNKEKRIMCKACNLDVSRQEAFAEQLLGNLSGGFVSLMVSIGHRTGLFDVLAETEEWITSADLASKAELNERYVREWLGAMATGRIIEVDAGGKTFRLPAEHAAFLSRQSKTDNMAVLAQFIAVLGGVEDEIVDCFKNGGGVPYSSYPRFHEVMAEDSEQSIVSSIMDVHLTMIPGIHKALEEGIDVLDAGCGRGKALNLLAKTYPKSRFVGLDLSEEAVAFAQAEAERNGSKNIEFRQQDLSDFHDKAPDATYDLVFTLDSIHDQPRPDNLLAGIYKTLKDSGVYFAQDIDTSSNVAKNLENPIASMIYTISCMHCMTVSLAQKGMGLGAAWGREKAVEMLEEAGFSNIEIRELEHDIQNCYYIVQK